MPTNVRFVELRHTIFALAASVLLVATGQAETAQKNWDDKCASCHGANGDGKTKQGVKLHIKDYTESKVQADFTDSGLLKNLLLGIAKENGVERMPGFKDKLTVAEAKDLIALIRTFKK
jgi:mono/diheme cytochrome c family protein